MRFLTITKTSFYITFLCFSCNNLTAQNKKTNIEQNPKFEQLLNEKRKINASLSVNDSYKVQVFSGNSDKAKKTLSDCKQNFANLEGTIVFNTPNYKVWIGNFKNRIEAERNLIEIKKIFENAFLIKPQK